ncbi:MAG: hypothetical protein JSU87_13860 [Gemmatimonadota bacterium]|nr:MAG: hypothetical protein JSU87_13860 [Gemmatimonadota bacterium]
MDLLNRADIRALMGERGNLCVSLYMPTHRAGAETQQDPIRLKNLLRQAEERLTEGGLRRAEAEKILAAAHRTLGDAVFWQHQNDGLAVFASPVTFRRYRVPFKFTELVVVTDRFHIKPLLPLLSGDGRFWILALSQKLVRLLQGTRFSVSELNPESMPTSLAEALGSEERERQLQFHVAAGGAPIFHGHGGGGTDEAVHKKDLLRYFKQIDKGLHDLLCVERVPLVLAGVDYLLPIYREASTCGELVEEGIAGNPDGLSAADLHAAAWEILEPHFSREQERAAAQYRELAGTERAASDLQRIVPAAHAGRVDSLFVAVGVQQWGSFRPEAGDVSLHDERQPGDQDLLDLAAVETLAHSGNVYAVNRERVPSANGSAIAAVFRY